MRLSENKIKEAILDSDPEIRQRAVEYFSESYSTDSSLMPLVIKAVETFGRADSHLLIGLSSDLRQSDETIAWIIDELNNEQSDDYESYTYSLSKVLADAEPALLLKRESDILGSRFFVPFLRERLSERLRMFSWSEATCWQELEDFCEQEKDTDDFDDVNVDYANLIVEALARYGDGCREKVHSLIKQEIKDVRYLPNNWIELLAVRLAGELRLDSAVPLIVNRLIEDDDALLYEDYIQALIRIGTTTVVEAISAEFPNGSDDFRLYATEPLEYIHCDLAVEKCLELLRQETEVNIRMNLAYAVLSHFAKEGIEEVRKLLVGKELDFEEKGLRSYLLATCTIMGERFPEYDAWLATEKAEKAEHRMRVNELRDDPLGLIRFAFEKLIGKNISGYENLESDVDLEDDEGLEDFDDVTASILPSPAPSDSTLPYQHAPGQRVGRNEPCPCGSGKKFKKCCLRTD